MKTDKEIYPDPGYLARCRGSAECERVLIKTCLISLTSSDVVLCQAQIFVTHSPTD